MSFFAALYNSLYNFKWLRNQKNNVSWAWSYFFLLIFLVAGLSSISLGFKYFDAAPKIKQTIYTELPEFQAEVKNGQLQVGGLVQPYIKNYENFTVAVDTTATSTVDIKSFVKQDNQSVLLITKDAFEVYDAQDKTTKSQTMKDFGDYKTDRTEILKKADLIFSSKMVWVVTVISFFVLLILMAVSNLINILLFSFVFYTIAKSKKLGWSFKEVFTVGLLAVTLPLIITQAIPSFSLNLLFVLIYSVWMYLIVLKKDK